MQAGADRLKVGFLGEHCQAGSRRRPGHPAAARSHQGAGRGISVDQIGEFSDAAQLGGHRGREKDGLASPRMLTTPSHTTETAAASLRTVSRPQCGARASAIPRS